MKKILSVICAAALICMCLASCGNENSKADNSLPDAGALLSKAADSIKSSGSIKSQTSMLTSTITNGETSLDEASVADCELIKTEPYKLWVQFQDGDTTSGAMEMYVMQGSKTYTVYSHYPAYSHIIEGEEAESGESTLESSTESEAGHVHNHADYWNTEVGVSKAEVYTHSGMFDAAYAFDLLYKNASKFETTGVETIDNAEVYVVSGVITGNNVATVVSGSIMLGTQRGTILGHYGDSIPGIDVTFYIDKASGVPVSFHANMKDAMDALLQKMYKDIVTISVKASEVTVSIGELDTVSGITLPADALDISKQKHDDDLGDSPVN